MEENVNQILGIGDNEEAKPQSLNFNSSKYEINNSAETTLSIVSKIVLVLGLVGGLILLCTMSTTEIPEGYYGTRTEINPTGIAVGITSMISSVMFWAFIQVIVNISNNLKNINYALTKHVQGNVPSSNNSTTSKQAQNEIIIKGDFMNNSAAALFANKVRDFLIKAKNEGYGDDYIRSGIDNCKRQYGSVAKEANYDLDSIIASVQEQINNL